MYNVPEATKSRMVDNLCKDAGVSRQKAKKALHKAEYEYDIAKMRVEGTYNPKAKAG